jgi:hypothetical protein
LKVWRLTTGGSKLESCNPAQPVRNKDIHTAVRKLKILHIFPSSVSCKVKVARYRSYNPM